ncbi:hypothetical protein YC2023_057513 [Brassica napus]
MAPFIQFCVNWEGYVPSKARIESIRLSCCGQIGFSIEFQKRVWDKKLRGVGAFHGGSINLTQKQHEQRDFFIYCDNILWSAMKVLQTK